MSAKDDLERFERACVELCDWRIERDKRSEGDPRNRVFANLLSFLPPPLRLLWEEDTSFWDHLAALAQKERRRLRLLARAEAERTLAEIPDEHSFDRPDPFAIEPAKAEGKVSGG
jgi:hypothetical protein